MAKKESLSQSVFGLIFFTIFFLMLGQTKDIYLAVFGAFALLVPLVIIFIVFAKRKKANFFNSRSTLEKIRSMKPDEFEEFIAHMFQKLGYGTEKIGGSYDGGIDVIAEKDGVKHYIQCKKFVTQQVAVGAIRDFYGAVTDKLTNAKAFFITTNVFTLEAEKFAEGKPIELIDGKKLMELVKLSGIEVADSNRPIFGSVIPEKCPWCGSALVLRTAKKGSNAGGNFYGCSNFPKCKYIKNIAK